MPKHCTDGHSYFFMEMNLAPLENIEKHILDLVYIQIFNRRRSSIIGYNNTN